MATNDSTVSALAENMSGVQCPIASFVSGLKTLETKSYIIDGSTRHGTMIVGFDVERLTAVCYSNSPDYNASLCDFDVIASEIFKQDDTWMNRGLVQKTMTVLAKLHGWCPRLTQKHLQCNRYGKDDTSRRYAAGALKCNCTFRITLSPWKKDRYMKDSKWFYIYDWNFPVTITYAYCNHGGMCAPGKQNRLKTTERSGKYIEDMPNNTLYTLCSLAEQNGKLPTSIIKTIIAPVLPTCKVITKNIVFNISLKVMRCLKIYRDTNGDYQQFKQFVNDSEFLSGIDSEVSLGDDEAYELATSLWAEVTNDVEKDEVIFSFIDYLQLISYRAKGFVYKLAYDESTIGQKKVVGVIWQTATMRRDFELFGDFISLDMMKRGINKLLWPYVGVAMYDEMRKLCVACEGVVCGERSDMYRFVAEFLAESSPLRKLEDVKIVAGDAFFSQELVTSLGFLNAILVLDRWHLLDSGLEKMFGKTGYEMLKGHVVGMVQSNSLEEFESFLMQAKIVLQSKEPRDGSLETTLQKFADNRKNFANFCVKAIPGNRGLLGSGSSEQNHSSALNFLNDGDKMKNSYCADVVTLIKDLLRRQKEKTKKTNDSLFASNRILLVEREQLANSVQTHIIIDLRNASEKLNLSSYERYKQRRFCAEKDLIRNEYIDPVSGESTVTVCSAKNPDAQPRIFRSTTDRCSCPQRLEEEDMCTHEIKAIGGFDETFFKQCHMAREKVTGSLEGWTEPKCNLIDEIIGYEEEEFTPPPPLPPSMNMPSPLAELEDLAELECGTDTLLVGTADVDNRIANPFKSVPVLPINQYERSSGKCKPLQNQVVKNISNTVSDVYKNLDENQQLEVSSLLLQLRDLITMDPKKSKTVTSTGGYSVRKPNQSLISSQAKKRIISMHERISKTASNKLNTNIQNLGIKQVVMGKDGVEIEVNGKTKSRRCQFCEEQHVFTQCNHRCKFKMNANEYLLSINQQYVQNERNLRTYIRDSMPYSVVEEGGEKINPTNILDSNCLRSNFIIHTACKDGHNVMYRISFLNKQAQTDKKLWITSDAMNSIITHNKKKLKFVYDETFSNKRDWMTLQKDDNRNDETVDNSTVADGVKVAASKRKRVCCNAVTEEAQCLEKIPKQAATREGSGRMLEEDEEEDEDDNILLSALKKK